MKNTARNSHIQQDNVLAFASATEINESDMHRFVYDAISAFDCDQPTIERFMLFLESLRIMARSNIGGFDDCVIGLQRQLFAETVEYSDAFERFSDALAARGIKNVINMALVSEDEAIG